MSLFLNYGLMSYILGAANLRERTRMRVLSKGFAKLKLMLPWVPPDTKLSKLDTLRLATSYISHLQRVLDDNGDEYSSGNDTKYQTPSLVRNLLFLTVSSTFVVIEILNVLSIYVRFISFLKCSNWRQISKLSSNFGCLFTFLYFAWAN